MVLYHYILVYLISSDWVERSVFLEVCCDHLSFVGKTALNDDRVLHELVRYSALEIVRYIIQITCFPLDTSWSRWLSGVLREIGLEP